MEKYKPKVHDDAFVASNAVVVGNVKVCKGASVWYNSVLRGDIENTEIQIGERSNIQDGTIVHVDYDQSTKIGKEVTVGHNCVIHACTIEDNSLIGMGAVVLSGAHIKKGAIVAAGAVVKENMVVPENTLVGGIPAKEMKEVSESAQERVLYNVKEYVKLGRNHKKGKYKIHEAENENDFM